MTNPSDHELNELLARVLGLRWGYCPETNEHGYFDAEGNFRYPERTFDPLHDANQMLLVRKNLGLRSWEMNRTRGRVFVKISNDHPQMGSPNVWEANNYDELRAFALAVYAMDQSQKGTT